MTQPLLSVRRLCLDTPSGRPLLRDLTLQLDLGDRVALVGRNGVGKSSLLRVLAGETIPTTGVVYRSGSAAVVSQQPAARDTQLSPGQAQRRRLDDALAAEPDLLLLDEPTHDLDADGIDWLVHRLRRWPRGLVVVSHERRILRMFQDFFVIAESGGQHVHGTFDRLREHLDRRAEVEQATYVRTLNDLAARERAHTQTQQRRARKKNLGRIRELKRCTPRSLLNGKKSCAQESQARRDEIQQARLQDARSWTKATRRALAIDLPLEVLLPTLPVATRPVAILQGVSSNRGGRVLFENLDLQLERQRLAIVGPNGAGKSTALRILLGELAPASGRARCDRHRVAYVSQNSANWCRDESLLERLRDASPTQDAATILRAHRFPFALADRPLRNLSPGERLRAALICAFAEAQTPEVLVLDEPTDHLDFVGVAALESVLRTWTGGLVVVSHDEELLDAIRIDRRIQLTARGHPRAAEQLYPSRSHGGGAKPGSTRSRGRAGST